MGNKQCQIQPKPRCSLTKCETIKCQSCDECPKCKPITRCLDCLQKKTDNISVYLNFKDLLVIYEKGIVKCIRPAVSQVQRQKTLLQNLFLKQPNHQFILNLEIQFKNDNEQKQKRHVVIEGRRANSGKMKIQISYGAVQIHQFQQILVSNKSFKELYHYAWEKLHGEDYYLIPNNCYHVGINLVQFLVPDISLNQLKQVIDYKDKQLRSIYVIL